MDERQIRRKVEFSSWRVNWSGNKQWRGRLEASPLTQLKLISNFFPFDLIGSDFYWTDIGYEVECIPADIPGPNFHRLILCCSSW